MQKCNKSLVLTTLITLFSSICIYSQNLIVNGDFESGGNGVGFITDGAGYSELLAPFSGTTVSGNFVLLPTQYHSLFILSTQEIIPQGQEKC